MPINTNVPPVTGPKSAVQFRDNFDSINRKIGTLPDDYSDNQPGELVAVNDEASGPAPAGDGVAALSGTGRPLYKIKPMRLDIAASTTLRGDTHEGALLRMRNTSLAVLQIERNADPTLGVQDGFAVTIERLPGSGGVQVSSSTLTNTHPNGHSRVASGRLATLYVNTVSSLFYLEGNTEA